jgi:tetratricopeptide (TPR) repeat protein/glutathione synthase/RimK-type ligase-like ATP-grasp enzyme
MERATVLASDHRRADSLAQAAISFAAGRFEETKAICLAELERAPDADDCALSRQLAMAHLLAHEFGPTLAILEQIAPHLPGDGKLRLAMAEAVWATRSAGAALPHFQAARALLPGDFSVRERFGLALLMAGDAEAAKHELEAAIELKPASVAALTHLGLAQVLTGAIERAIPHFEAALEIDPDSVDTLFQLGTALRAGGHHARAIVIFRGAVARAPGSALLRVALGDALKDIGDAIGAVTELFSAVRLEPAWPVAWTTLADCLNRLGQTQQSISAYRTALLLDPTQAEVHALLGNVLHAAGAVEDSHRHYARSMQAAPWSGKGRAAAGISVAVLAAPGSANTPTRFILDRSILSVDVFYVLPGADEMARRLSDSVDIVFNSVSDPDSAATEFADLTHLVAGLGTPVLNHPERIQATRRDRMRELLGHVDGCVLPRTLRCAAGDFTAAADFARAVGYPVLVRPVGSHGGDGLVKIETDAELKVPLAAYGDVYITKFHDARSDDGWYRKYRLIIVDGVILPYHLAVNDDWLVHYFRSPTKEMSAFRDEEVLFLDEPEQTMGAVAFSALRQIAETVKLDFFGIDCAVDRSGRLLVFECNATMLVRDGEQPALVTAKGEAARRIRDAVTAMIERRITG